MFDRRANRTWHAAGTARFEAASPVTFRYVEAVHVHGDGVHMNASRAYLYHVAGPDRLRIDFDDGTPFCVLSFEDGVAYATHPCRDDAYRGTITLESKDCWRTAWTVTGPAKHLLIATEYVAVADADGPTSAPA